MGRLHSQRLSSDSKVMSPIGMSIPVLSVGPFILQSFVLKLYPWLVINWDNSIFGFIISFSFGAPGRNLAAIISRPVSLLTIFSIDKPTVRLGY